MMIILHTLNANRYVLTKNKTMHSDTFELRLRILYYENIEITIFRICDCLIIVYAFFKG